MLIKRVYEVDPLRFPQCIIEFLCRKRQLRNLCVVLDQRKGVGLLLPRGGGREEAVHQ